MIRISKRASDDTLWVEVMWILLTLIVFVVFFIFVNKTLDNQNIYEEVYAKKISLIVDGALPGSVFFLDVTNPVDSARKSGKNCFGESGENSCFFINQEKNLVGVKLGKELAYTRSFFSDYNVDLSLNIKESRSILVVEVNE